MNFEDRILNVNETSFEEIALQIFQYQVSQNPVYAEFLDNLSIDKKNITSLEQIPFLPVEVFKYREVRTGVWQPETYFESSGTTKQNLAKHDVRSLDWYHSIARICFELHFGDLKKFVFIALLPSYLERKHSSLVDMVNFFVQESGSPANAAFFIDEFEALKNLLECDWNGKTPILFGVRFALLDFAEQFPGNYPGLVIIETGGMKGRRREMSNVEFVSQLKDFMKGVQIASEYGMTELTSQAYSLEEERLWAPKFIRFFITHPTIPGLILGSGQRGLVSVIDLANVHTCSFLQTSDVGVLSKDGHLNVLGRYSTAESRGCAMLYEQS